MGSAIIKSRLISNSNWATSYKIPFEIHYKRLSNIDQQFTKVGIEKLKNFDLLTYFDFKKTEILTYKFDLTNFSKFSLFRWNFSSFLLKKQRANNKLRTNWSKLVRIDNKKIQIWSKIRKYINIFCVFFYRFDKTFYIT